MKNLTLVIIKKEEGCKLAPYYCSEEYPTIGWGCRIGNKYEPLPPILWTQALADKNLEKTIAVNLKTIMANPDLFRAYKNCGDVQRAVFESMTYQLGVYGVLEFKRFLSALYGGDYLEASSEMLKSLAARQTPERWKRAAKMMLLNTLHDYYSDENKKS